MPVAVMAVHSGPAGLVVVQLRLEDGTVRRVVLPRKSSGVSEIEWSAQALNTLNQIKARAS